MEANEMKLNEIKFLISNFSYHITSYHIKLHHIISNSHVLSILYDAFQRQSDMLLSYLFSDKVIRQSLKKKMREV